MTVIEAVKKFNLEKVPKHYITKLNHRCDLVDLRKLVNAEVISFNYDVKLNECIITLNVLDRKELTFS